MRFSPFRLLPLVALATSFGLLGCAPALPLGPVVGDGAAAQPAAATGLSAAPTAVVAPTAGPAVTPAMVPAVPAAQGLSVPGMVSLQGKPFVGASLKLLDAVTGQAMPLAAPVTTDAQGGFTLPLASLNAGQVVRVVASKDGNTVATLVTSNATAAAFRLAEVSASAVFTFDRPSASAAIMLSEATTILAQMADGPLSLGQGLQGQAQVKAQGAELRGLLGVLVAFKAYFAANQTAASALAQQALSESGLPGAGGASGSAISVTPGAFAAANAAVQQALAPLAGLTQPLAFTPRTLLGTAVTAKVVAGTLQLTSAGGTSVALAGPGATATAGAAIASPGFFGANGSTGGSSGPGGGSGYQAPAAAAAPAAPAAPATLHLLNRVAGAGSDGLKQPRSVAVDGTGNFYIADTRNSRIRMGCQTAGTYFGQVMSVGNIYTVAGNGTAGFSGDLGAATSAQLNLPQAVSVDGAGNLYIVDSKTRRLRMVCQTAGTYFGQVMSAGNIYTVAGNGTPGSSGDLGAATSAQLGSPFGVSVDGTGNLYIADGAYSRIRMVCQTAGTYFGQAMSTGNIYTVAGNGTGGFSGDLGAATSAQLNLPQAVSVDGAGNLYIGDSFNSRLRMVCQTAGTYFGQVMSTGNIYTVAGNGTAGFSGDLGAATSAQLNTPLGVSVDGAGNLYLADAGNSRLRVVCQTAGTYFGQAMSTGKIYTVAGNGMVGFSGDLGAATSAQLNNSQGVSVDGAGNLYLADTSNNRLRKVDTTGIITSVAGKGGAGYSGDLGAATSAQLNTPQGVSVDGAGNLYIADSFNSRLRMVCQTAGTYFGQAMSAGKIYTVAGNGMAGFSGDMGAATSAQLNNPQGVSVDGAGNLYIVDTDNNRLRVVCQTAGTYFGIAMTAGNIYTVAGNGTGGFSGDLGAATSAQLGTSQGVSVDGAGNLYLADAGNSRLRMVCQTAGTYFGQVMSTGNIYTVAGNGTFGFSGDLGAATSAQLNSPFGVSVDGTGNLYLADNRNNRIRMVCQTAGTYFGQVMSTGNIYTVAGNGMAGFSGDLGAATSAQLNNPLGVSVDGTGNLYLADNSNNRIRKVDTTGIITTVVGTPTVSNPYPAGEGTSNAELRGPRGVVVSGGTLYIIDGANRVVTYNL